MNTPLRDFVTAYQRRHSLRLHMPGHKGRGPLGVEKWDITEIDGADVLYHAEGVIRQSEQNAARLFGAGRTVYSTEGSSLCIRAMIYLAKLHAQGHGRACRILAGRNAHKVFINTAALLDVQVSWLYPKNASLLTCLASPEEWEAALERERPTAVYLTSPDYLGNRADVAALARVCHAHGALLLVDNAHGAYLKFLPASQHPMDLGADLCCDSAHKTLPALTGAAYLHIASDPFLMAQADQAMALFASTSPSYLILQSLDLVNAALAGEFPARLARTAALLEKARESLTDIPFVGQEPMKWTIRAKPLGYTGEELAAWLFAQGVECEFADPDFVVMMFSPQNTRQEIERLRALLMTIPRKEPVLSMPPALPRPVQRMSPHDALMSPRETLPLCQAEGRVLAAACVTCPPAVPVVTLGQEIDRRAVACMEYYHIQTCMVVADSNMSNL